MLSWGLTLLFTADIDVASAVDVAADDAVAIDMATAVAMLWLLP